MGKLTVPKDRQLLLPGFKITPVGAIANKGVTLEQCQDALSAIGHIEVRLSWVIGDVIAATKDKYKDYGSYEEICEQHDISYATATNCVMVSRALEVSRRRETLSWNHHAEVANREDAERPEAGHWGNADPVGNTTREHARRAGVSGSKPGSLVATSVRVGVDTQQFRRPVYRPRAGLFFLSIAAWAVIITGIWWVAK